jgi:hypothetical protein
MKNKFLYKLLSPLAMLLLILSIGCKRTPIDVTPTPTEPGVVVVGGDVYVAGFERNTAGINVATLWKNGIATYLSSGVNNTYANSVFVSGSDVYIAGFEESNGFSYYVAKVWKNGVVTNLVGGANNNAKANSVFVSGQDVYVAGIEYDNFGGTKAKYWKNGISNYLTPSGANYTCNNANSIFVSGNDVYIAGDEYGGSSPFLGTYTRLWKNSYPVFLNRGYQSKSNSVFVSGTDVYIAGSEYNGTSNVAKLWKNSNIPIDLPYGTQASSVFVSGQDVYVAGTGYNVSTPVAKYWKNGMPTNLSNGVLHAYAFSVYVFGPDIYIVGQERNIAVVWRNGVPIYLSSSFSLANSIFVK